MTRRRFLPSLGRGGEAKAAVDRRHSAGPTYAFAGTPYMPVTDLELDRVIRDSYERDVWVYRAVDARAKNAARIDVLVKDGRGMGAETIEGHDLAVLLNRQANPYESAYAFRYRLHTLLDLSVTKGVFVEVSEHRGRIARLDLLNPMHTWPVPDPDKFVARFEMRLATGEVFEELPPYREGKGGVLWITRPHPTDPYQSTSWIKAAGLSIDLDYWARRYNLNFLFNDGRPGGVLAIKSSDEFDGIDPADASVLQARMSGGPDAAGKVTLLEADHVEWIDLAQSPRDAQYVEGRAITQREILVAAGTPLSVIGDASGRTFDNADAEFEGFWRSELKPELEMVGNFWEMLTPGGMVDDTEVVTYDWDSVSVLQRDRRELAARLLAEVQAGVRTIDSYREATGEEPFDIPGSRVLWFDSGKAPIGEEADVTALLTQGQSPPAPPALPPGGEAPAALGPGPTGPPRAGGYPEEGEVLEAELVDPLDETLWAVKTLERVRPDVADTRRAEHAALIDHWTGQVAAEVLGMLRRQEGIVLARLRGAKARRHTRHWTYATPPTHELKVLDPAYVIERGQWIEQAVEIVAGIVVAAFHAAAAATAAALGKPEAAAEVDGGLVARVVRLIAEGLDARAGRLQEIIAERDAAGASVDEIAEAVSDAYLSSDTWADVTSRSVVGAMNGASLITASNAGALAKRWLATDDERTRPTHRAAEGQVRPLADPFQVGEGLLEFPGDPTGPIGEVINCRCTMVYALGPYVAEERLDADLAALEELEREWKAFRAVNVTFDPRQHPRDWRGRFIDVPDVLLPDGSAGVAIATDERGDVVVARAEGGTATVAPEALTEREPNAPSPAAPDAAALRARLPEPGTTPIPAGHIRLYHQTPPGNVESIRRTGLRAPKVGKAGDPPGLWSGTRPFYKGDGPLVEFHVPVGKLTDLAQDTSAVRRGEVSPEDADYHSVILTEDVPPEGIVAVHEPWMASARYMIDRGLVAEALAGEYEGIEEKYDKATAWLREQADPTPAITRADLSNPDTPRSRAVTPAEFGRLAAMGRARLAGLRAGASPPEGLDRDFDAIKDRAWDATREEWGGLTVDAHTGTPLEGDEDLYALSVKPAGMESVSVPIGATREELDAAMEQARRRFGSELANRQHYLGVFRDEDNGRIDIDPVLVVTSVDDVESIGAYTRAVGGAYHFADGNGYWPPHIEEAARGGEGAGLQGPGSVAVAGGRGAEAPGAAARAAPGGAGAPGEVAPRLEVRDYEGEYGDPTHITRIETGTVPTGAVAGLPGVAGETPGEHRNRQGGRWQAFLDDVRENGIREPIFITVDPGEGPRISEGNHRRDAAVELGLPEVPVEVRYFGHAERDARLIPTEEPNAPSPRRSVPAPDPDAIRDEVVAYNSGSEDWTPEVEAAVRAGTPTALVLVAEGGTFDRERLFNVHVGVDTDEYGFIDGRDPDVRRVPSKWVSRTGDVDSRARSIGRSTGLPFRVYTGQITEARRRPAAEEPEPNAPSPRPARSLWDVADSPALRAEIDAAISPYLASAKRRGMAASAVVVALRLTPADADDQAIREAIEGQLKWHVRLKRGRDLIAGRVLRRLREEPNAPSPAPDYGGRHRPPDREYGASMDDPSAMFPDLLERPELYVGPRPSPAMDELTRHWTERSRAADLESVAAIRAAAADPDAPVTVYRAVPAGVPDATIGPGDWVTPSRAYAEIHGESNLGGDYRVIEREVRAGDLFTEGNSVDEWGWVPVEPNAPSPRGPVEPSPHEEEHRWELPKGRVVEQRGDTWLLWDRPGHLLYTGDAEGLQAELAKLGIGEEGNAPYPSWWRRPALPRYLTERFRTKTPEESDYAPGSYEDQLARKQQEDIFLSPAATPERWQLARLPDGRYGQVASPPDADGLVDIVGATPGAVERHRLLDLTPGGPAPFNTAYDREAERHVFCAKGHRHWGAGGAAGVMIRTDDPDGQTRYLMQKRARWVQWGGTWSTPGGALHLGEAPGEGATREAAEELGAIPDLRQADVFTDDHGGWAYHTVVLDSPEQFARQRGGDYEGVEIDWFTAEEIDRLDLHPSFRESWPALRARMEGGEPEGPNAPLPDAAHMAAGPTAADFLDDPQAALSATAAAHAGRVPVADMNTALAAMLARAGIEYDPNAPSVAAGELALKSGQAGDGAKARAMIPTVEQLIDQGVWRKVKPAKGSKYVYPTGWDVGDRVRLRWHDLGGHDYTTEGWVTGHTAVHTQVGTADYGPVITVTNSGIDSAEIHVDLGAEEAAKEWKRQYNAARFRVRDARLKAAKAAKGKVAQDKAKPKEGPDPETSEVDDLVAGLEAQVEADAASGAAKPLAFYDAQHGAAGPGGVTFGHNWWESKGALALEDGDAVPVVHLHVAGRLVEHGTVFKFPGAPPILIEHEAGAGKGVVSEAGTVYHPAQARAERVAMMWHKVTQDTNADVARVQRGYSWLLGPNPNDGHWAEKYQMPGFKSAATSGNGHTELWNVDPTVGLLAHEFGHNVDRNAASSEQWHSLTNTHPSPGLPQKPAGAEPGTPDPELDWEEARAADQPWAQRWADYLKEHGKSFHEKRHAPGDNPLAIEEGTLTEAEGTLGLIGCPTDYARADTREDFAESVRLYLKDRRLSGIGWLDPDEGQSSGPVVRFADVWPERARFLDTVFGNAPGASAFQSEQRWAIEATLKAVTKGDDDWVGKDPATITDGWPADEDLAASFVVPTTVVQAARAKAHADLLAEMKETQAKLKAEAEAAAKAAKLAEEQAAKLAAKAKAAADRIEASLKEAAAAPAQIVPGKDAVKKIRKRKAWVKWNAKQRKVTPLPATGEDGYQPKDLVKRDSHNKVILPPGGKVVAEFVGRDNGRRYRGKPSKGIPASAAAGAGPAIEFVGLEELDPNSYDFAGHAVTVDLVGADDLVYHRPEAKTVMAGMDVQEAETVWVLHPDGSMDVYSTGVTTTQDALDYAPGGGNHWTAAQIASVGPENMPAKLKAGEVPGATQIHPEPGAWRPAGSNTVHLSMIEPDTLERVDHAPLTEAEAQKVADAYESGAMDELAAKTAAANAAGLPQVEGLTAKQVGEIAKGAQAVYDEALANGVWHDVTLGGQSVLHPQEIAAAYPDPESQRSVLAEALLPGTTVRDTPEGTHAFTGAAHAFTVVGLEVVTPPDQGDVAGVPYVVLHATDFKGEPVDILPDDHPDLWVTDTAATRAAIDALDPGTQVSIDGYDPAGPVDGTLVGLGVNPAFPDVEVVRVTGPGGTPEYFINLMHVTGMRAQYNHVDVNVEELILQGLETGEPVAAVEAELDLREVALDYDSDEGVVKHVEGQVIAVNLDTGIMEGEPGLVITVDPADGPPVDVQSGLIVDGKVTVMLSAQDADTARTDYIYQAVHEALAAGPAGQPGAPSKPGFDPKLRKKAATWLHKHGGVAHPLAKSTYAEKAVQQKSNIAAEIGRRLNNPEDWEKFRAYRKGLGGVSSGDKYGQVPFDVPPFDEVDEATRQAWLDQEASNRIGNWASTSGDTSPSSLGMQRAILEEFGTGGAWNPHHMPLNHGMSMMEGVQGAKVGFQQAWDNGMREFFRAFVRRMYENTQEQLAEEGVTELSLYRGMTNASKGGQWTIVGEHEVTDLMPANSFCTSKGTAEGFGGGYMTGRMLVATFPASRILGSARTGFGCWGEWEFIVLNGPGNITVYTGGSSAIPEG